MPALFSKTGHPLQPAASAVAVIGWNDVTHGDRFDLDEQVIADTAGSS